MITREEIEDFLADYVAKITQLNVAKIQSNVPFERYGLDSTAAVGLSGVLSEHIGLDLEEDLVFNYPTISAVSDRVFSLLLAQQDGDGNIQMRNHPEAFDKSEIANESDKILAIRS